jgi:RNA polymerase sigma-70 factor (ECF subfamily)
VHQPRASSSKKVTADEHSELLRQLYPVVRKQIHFLLGPGAVADDAVQETMIAVYRGLPKFRGDASVKTWAIAIAMRTARRVRRQNARHAGEEEAEIAVFDTDQTGAAELVMLQRALDVLSPKKREAFVLMGILELTAQEAGSALGTFANTAASRYRHACAELERSLTDPAGSDAPKKDEP